MNFGTELMDVSKVVFFIGFMAFLVSIVTECLKRITWLEQHIPTSLTVILLSLILCPAALAAMMCYYHQPITWYMVFAAFIAAFIVALISMDGWERIAELASRTIPKDAGK